MLLVLVLAGSLALGWSLPLSLAIMLLLVILRALSVDLEPEETTQMKAQGAPRSEWGPRLDPLRHAR
jgi:hypothetical protein